MIFCATRYSAILVPPSPSSATFSPAVFGGFGVDASTVEPALASPTSSPSTPISASVSVVDFLLLGGHDALEGREARLVDLLGDADDGGQRAPRG